MRRRLPRPGLLCGRREWLERFTRGLPSTVIFVDGEDKVGPLAAALHKALDRIGHGFTRAEIIHARYVRNHVLRDLVSGAVHVTKLVGLHD
jgi:hypothetical protein